MATETRLVLVQKAREFGLRPRADLMIGRRVALAHAGVCLVAALCGGGLVWGMAIGMSVGFMAVAVLFPSVESWVEFEEGKDQ